MSESEKACYEAGKIVGETIGLKKGIKDSGDLCIRHGCNLYIG